VLYGWAGLKGAVARTKHGDARTAGSEQRERLRTAARRASPRDWGFGGVLRRVIEHVQPSGRSFGGIRRRSPVNRLSINHDDIVRTATPFTTK